MAYDSGKGEIFAQYGDEIGGSGIVEVISDSTNQIVANITEGTACGFASCYLGDVVYDSGKGEIFTAYGDEKAQILPQFSVISDSNNSLVATISWNTPGNSQYNWPAQPTAMVYDSGKGEIFVSDVASYSGVFVISDSNNAIVATIGGVEHSPGEMVYDSAKGEVFVANYNQVSVISDGTNQVVANISVSATSLAYDPAKGEVFAYNGSAISVISDSTNQVVATIGVTGGSTGIAYDSTKGEIFAGAIISDDTNTVVAHLPSGIGNIIYDSGKGEIIGTASTGLDLFLDSSVATTSSTAATSTTATSTTQQTTTTTSKSGSGSVPEFPYQLLAAAAFTALLGVSYVLVRSRTMVRNRPAIRSVP